MGTGDHHVPTILVTKTDIMNESKKELLDAIDKLKPDECIRIRKLTPRECGRLMDVSESDLDKMMAKNEKGEQIISNSQLYKMFGNSIVVSCMTGIFENLFYPKGRVYKPGYQFTIFDYGA